MAKRFTTPSINWVELEKRVPRDQKTKFLAFKGKADVYLRRVLANPPDLPKIDWEHYQKIVPIPGLVDKFKKDYESFKIPFPTDTLTASIDAQWTKLQVEIKAFSAQQQQQINEADKELARINALPKYEDMTMEMYKDMFPNDAIDPVNKPTFWPHNLEEQPGYKTPEQKTSKH